MSNMNGDLLDDGLRAVMGEDRCKDVYGTGGTTEGTEIATPVCGLARNDKNGGAAARKRQDTQGTAVDAKWVKVDAGASMAKVKNCAKWALLFGGISALLFWWQQAGLLDPKAAVPSLIICALGAGLSVGWNAK